MSNACRLLLEGRYALRRMPEMPGTYQQPPEGQDGVDASTPPPSVDTMSGRQIVLDGPLPRDIDIVDIAARLSKLCRFGAQAASFYSVAQHSVYVMTLVSEGLGRPDLALAALHHDSSEAYIGDLPTPVKRHLAGHAGSGPSSYRQLSDRFDEAVAEALGFAPPSADDQAVIKSADLAALAAEAQHLMPRSADRIIAQVHSGHSDIEPAPHRPLEKPLLPTAAEIAFLDAHRALTGQTL